MSPLDLFIVASVVGAAAFFFAGLLLRPRRAPSAPQTHPDTHVREQLAAELTRALSQRATAEQSLVDARLAREQLEEERHRDTEKFISGERERQQLRSELEERKRETDRFILTQNERDRLVAELEERKRDTEKFIITQQERDRLAAQLEERKRDTEKFIVTQQERDRLAAQLEEVRKRETEKVIAGERERERLRTELDKAREQGRQLQERVRVAENENRAAFEREEKASVAFQQRLTVATAEGQEREAARRKEMDELRAQLGQLTSENQHLQQERLTLASRESSMRQEMERLRANRQASAQESERAQEAKRAAELREELALNQAAQEQNRIQAALQSAEKREAEMLARLAQLESERRGKTSAAEETLRVQQARWQAEMERLAHEMTERHAEAAKLREQNQTLALAAGTSQEELVKTRAQLATLTESLRAAEKRVADNEGLALEIVRLREEWAQAEQSQQDQEGEAKDAKVQLAAAQAKLTELAQVLDENRKLRDQVEDLRGNQNASEELDRLNAEHKRLRLDAELMARRLQELLQDQNELSTLRTQAADAISLSEEVNYLRRREKDLEAQLYSCGFRVSRDMPAVVDPPSVPSPMGTMESNLQALVGAPGPRTAVLADTQGFLIASAGESWVEEGLAAFAAVAADMVTRTQSLLPMTRVESVRLTDANSTVLTCRLFEAEGEGLGVTTLGSDEPPSEESRRAIAGLAAILSSGRSGLSR